METAFARPEQLLGICFALGSGRNWRALRQPALYRTRPERLHDTSSALICLFCNRWDIFISWEQMGALCDVPTLFPAFMIPLPEAAVDSLEDASKNASAGVA